MLFITWEIFGLFDLFSLVVVILIVGLTRSFRAMLSFSRSIWMGISQSESRSRNETRLDLPALKNSACFLSLPDLLGAGSGLELIVARAVLVA